MVRQGWLEQKFTHGTIQRKAVLFQMHQVDCFGYDHVAPMRSDSRADKKGSKIGVVAQAAPGAAAFPLAPAWILPNGAIIYCHASATSSR